MRSLKLAAVCAVSMVLWTNSAFSKEAGDWIVRAGITQIVPKSGNGSVDVLTAELDVGNATMFTFDGTYMISDSFGIELLAALPFKHDVYAKSETGRQKIATVKHLPPTLSAVYHFNGQGKFQPYAGAGVNWTIFFSEKEKGVVEDLNASLKLKNSLGLAAVVGLDIALTKNMFLNANVRYMDIDSDVKLNGSKIAKAAIDPWIYSINVGWRF